MPGLMWLLWLFLAAGWLLALMAWMSARRVSRRSAELTTMYWELKYEVGEMKARLRALAPEDADAAQPSPRAPVQGFVALSDVKRKT
jgi:hypothetical protein